MCVMTHAAASISPYLLPPSHLDEAPLISTTQRSEREREEERERDKERERAREEEEGGRGNDRRSGH